MFALFPTFGSRHVGCTRIRFEVSLAARIKTNVFWNIKLSTLVDHLAFRLHLQGTRGEVAGSFEIFVPIYQTARNDLTEDRNLDKCTHTLQTVSWLSH
jgi:hypothetical protein